MQFQFTDQVFPRGVHDELLREIHLFQHGVEGCQAVFQLVCAVGIAVHSDMAAALQAGRQQSAHIGDAILADIEGVADNSMLTGIVPVEINQQPVLSMSGIRVVKA